MLVELRLRNFRCFKDHTLPFRPASIIVGRNNAGKSTIVEALRLVSIVVSRYPDLNFIPAPPWLPPESRLRGVSPALDGLEFNFDNSVFYRYGEHPSVITAVFDTGAALTIYLGPDAGIHVLIFDSDGRLIISKAQARQNVLPKVEILPQVGPLAQKERTLAPNYVKGALGSRLTPLHFRNQLHVLNQHFVSFSELAERTWPGFGIRQLGTKGAYPDGEHFLLVRDGDFVAEIGHMGHGLQMWLQVMWFLARANRESTIILDEPDVYLHADLQRKLIRLLRGQYRQVIVATHSIEIMTEVKPDQILMVDRRRRTSKFATSLPSVQKVIEHIGAAQNLQLAKLWGSSRCILVEGKDIILLKQFQDIIFPESSTPFDTFPNMPIGGWSGWPYAVGSSMLTKNALGERIITYCILDSDYHTDKEIQERMDEAVRRNIQLHIWSKKEIENYLLIPEVIGRVIADDKPSNRPTPDVVQIANEMDRLCGSIKEPIKIAIGNEIFLRDRSGGLPGAMQMASDIVESNWQTHQSRLAIVSGKWLLSQMSAWSKATFGVSFGSLRIAQELHRNEVDPEIVSVVTAIERRNVLIKQS